jgi:hypothetical protein
MCKVANLLIFFLENKPLPREPGGAHFTLTLCHVAYAELGKVFPCYELKRLRLPRCHDLLLIL